ncbi:hypothetical protein [Streptomyces sp. x-19]|uniref:hypothetical protein n=1 Tax=Streptomyces sp. x-19 TaxID=2789280 RepID=UPI0039812857
MSDRALSGCFAAFHPKNEFYERVRNETQQIPETEKRLRETVTKLRKTLANKEAELEELRQRVTLLTLAGAVLPPEEGPISRASSGPGQRRPLPPAEPLSARLAEPPASP